MDSMSAPEKPDTLAAALNAALQPLSAALAAQAAALAAQGAQLTSALTALSAQGAALAELREETRELRALLPLRELLLPKGVRQEINKDKRRHNFLSCLILTAQNGFGQDVEPFLALCRETWGEEVLWDAVKDLPHGKLKLKKADGTPMMVDEARADGTTVRVQAVDPFGKKLTRVMYAAQAGDVARLRWLIARGARLELKDWEGRTALYWASREGRAETVRELLLRGAAVDAARNTGTTPLCIASQNNHLEVVRELLARGAAVDAARYTGATPLLMASQEGNLEVVRVLLASGASPRTAANNGATALSCATASGHAAVAALIRAALEMGLGRSS
jgi:hypothetical protein